MIKDRRSRGFGDGLGALGIYRAGSLQADFQTKPWAWALGNRIITTPDSFAWNQRSGWGDRSGVAHIIRKKQMLPGGWERGIATARRFFGVIYMGGSALRTALAAIPQKP